MSHEHYEALMMKAVDGVLTDEERVQLEEHLDHCDSCAAELADFHQIKEITDAMTERILQNARIQPPRERGAARSIVGGSFALLLCGALLLLGFSVYTFAVDTDVPAIVKLGSALAGAGAIGLLGYALRLRAGKDPYEEIDQ